MDIFIILILWTVIGCLYFGNLVVTGEYDEMEEWVMAIAFLLFLPSTMFYLIVVIINEAAEYIKKRFKDGRR